MFDGLHFLQGSLSNLHDILSKDISAEEILSNLEVRALPL